MSSFRAPPKLLDKAEKAVSRRTPSFAASAVDKYEETLEHQQLVQERRRQQHSSLPSSPNLQQLAYDHEQALQGRDETIQEKDETIAYHRAANESLQTAARRAEEELRQTKRKVTNLETQLEASKEELRVALKDMDYTDISMTALHSSNLEYSQKLIGASGTINELTAKNQELQARAARLEDIVQHVSQEGGTDFKSLEAERFNMQIAHDTVSSKLQSQQAFNSKLRNTVAASKIRIAALEDENKELKERCASLDQYRPRTLRSLLTLRHMEHALYTQDSIQDGGHSPDTEIWKPTVTTADSLDKLCNPAEFQTYVSFLSEGQAQANLLSRLRLQICSRCNRAKFNLNTDGIRYKASLSWLHEYHNATPYFSCCYEQVCKTCFSDHVVSEFMNSWWYKLGHASWIRCPRTGCKQYISIQREADVEGCIGRLCGLKAEAFVQAFVKIVALRKVLEDIVPRPPLSARKNAAMLHDALYKAGRIFDFFDTRFDATVADETGCIPEFDPGTILDCTIDSEASKVPLFRKFLCRQSTPKDCIVCSKSFLEISYGDVETWKKTCKGFEGPWMWNILIFPTSETQKCDKHNFDVCRTCTETHLRETLKSSGPSACNNLSCPQCRRKLAYEEVKALADAETFAKYDKFLLKRQLSTYPDFRWCLNPLCENGDVHESIEDNPMVVCSECTYQMCFHHSTPWHHDLSCAEYDSLKLHGDPKHRETQNWIRTNTKPCPGCQVGIQKGESCFHMTCTQCSHEFCWQCLASWADVKARGQYGHAYGCHFRTNNIEATSVWGENIEVALRARNNRG